MQPNDRASAACACEDGEHTDTIFWPPCRVPQITALMRVFVTMARWTAHANKSAHIARKAKKRRFHYCAHIIGKKQRNINAKRPLLAYIILLFIVLGASPLPHTTATLSSQKIFSENLALE